MPGTLTHPVDDFEIARRFIVAASLAELGLYGYLAEPKSMDEAVSDLNLDPRATDIVFRAAVESGLFARNGNLYTLIELGEAYAAKCKDANPFAHQLGLFGKWSKLPDVVRSGEPVPREPSSHNAHHFMAAMASRPPTSVAAVADAIHSRFGPGRLLDLGGGPGLYSRALIERGWTATLFDMPPIIEHVREAYGLDHVEGLDLVPGNFLETLPKGDFDVALCGNVIHIFSAQTNSRLLARLSETYPTLKGVGIIDFVIGKSPGAELFAVNMLVNTTEGNTYSLEEIKQWLKDAHFGGVDCLDVDEQHHQLLLADKIIREG